MAGQAIGNPVTSLNFVSVFIKNFVKDLDGANLKSKILTHIALKKPLSSLDY